MQDFVGLDFGTTNSVLAVAGPRGDPTLVELPGPGGPSPVFRSILYFEPPEPGESERITAGPPAIARYLETEGEGRLVQSVKSHLSSALLESTRIYGRLFTVEELVGAFLIRMRAAAGRDLGRRVVAGRPVRFWGSQGPDDDARAVRRLRAALALAGFDEIVLEPEPVAAARRYAARLDHDELVLVSDLGGGTSDFCLLRVGPSIDPDDPGALLGTAGLGVGGDAFDARIIDGVVAPALGRGTSYTPPLGRTMQVPPWLFTRLRRWHLLSFLKSPETMRLLERIVENAEAPERIAALVHLVRNDLGLPLSQAVEATKLVLSAAGAARFRFLRPPIDLAATVPRRDFDDWIAPDVEAAAAVADGLLASTGIAPGDVDRVFTTGGSSFVPAVRSMLAARFGEDRLAGGDELTSVAWGLALSARDRFRDRS